MRAYIWVAGAILLIAVVGCGKKDVVVTDTEGNKVTVTPGAGDNNKVTVEGKDGKATVTGNGKDATMTMEGPKGSVTTGGGVEVSEAELGLPYYPGAEKGNSTRSDTADGAMYTVTLNTTDAVDKVAAFYKGKMAGAESVQTDTGGKPMVMLMKKDGKDERNVHIQKADGKTMIIVVHVIKK